MTKPHLTKKCAVCGLQKPLSAFLIMSQTEASAQYGNVCAHCRKAEAEQQEKLKDQESDTTSSGTVDRHTIDNKTKVAIERDKKQRSKETEMREFEAARQEEAEKNETIEKKSTQHQEEKKLRMELFDSLATKKPFSKTATKQLTEKAKQDTVKQRHFLQEKKFREENLQKEEYQQTQKDINELNFSGPLSAPTHSLKYQSTTFKQFLAVVGEGSAFARNLNKLQEKQTPAPGKQPAAEPTVEDLTTNLNKPTTRKK